MPAHPQLIATRDLACGVDVTGLEDLPGLDQLPRYRDGGVPAGLLADHVEGIDLTQLDADTDVLNVAVLTDRLISWAQAMHLAALAELACRPETLRGDGPREPAPIRRDGTLVREHAADEVGAALGMTSRAAQSRVWTAMPLCTQFPGTWTALAAGRIDYLRMHALVEEAGGIADDEVLAQVEDRLLARRPGRSPGEFRTAVRRAVLRADADAAKARAEQARADTYVRTRPAQTDTAWLDAHLPAEDALAIRLVLDAAAAAMRGQGEGRSADQLRAAALAAPFWQALATGQLSTIDGPLDLAVAHGQAPTLDLDLHPDESTVELRGYGPITAVLGREVAARARDGRHPTVRVHQHGTDAAATAAADWPVEPGYRPSTALVRHVVDRDQRCRFPGCTTSARWTDVDHTTAWPAGPTHPANLALLCRRHHQYKQTTHVTLTQPAPGRLRWTLPTGHVYDVGPPD